MKVAITGTIGSGKSQVSNYLRNLGYDVFDCDAYNQILLSKGNLGYLELQKAFPQVFDGEELNKAKLADIVFIDKVKKSELEAILHPLILDKMLLEAENKDIFFAEVPLLFESNWDKYFDLTILVVTDTDILINRLLEKGLNINDINRRINSQMSIEDKLKRADEIIYNNGSLAHLYSSIDEIICKYVR